MRYLCRKRKWSSHVSEVFEVNHLRVSDSDANDFLDFLKCAVAENRIIRPYNELKDALVFSFDAEWKGFSNFSKGWHKDRRMRRTSQNA